MHDKLSFKASGLISSDLSHLLPVEYCSRTLQTQENRTGAEDMLRFGDFSSLKKLLDFLKEDNKAVLQKSSTVNKALSSLKLQYPSCIFSEVSLFKEGLCARWFQLCLFSLTAYLSVGFNRSNNCTGQRSPLQLLGDSESFSPLCLGKHSFGFCIEGRELLNHCGCCLPLRVQLLIKLQPGM